MSGVASASESGKENCQRPWCGHPPKAHQNNWCYSCAAKCSSLDHMSVMPGNDYFEYDWKSLEQAITALVRLSDRPKENQRIQLPKVAGVDEE